MSKSVALNIIAVSTTMILWVLLFGSPLKVRVREETESTGATQTTNPERARASDKEIIFTDNRATG